MNFNASRNVGQGGPRKAKRVSDISAMGAPTPVPPPAAGYGPGPGFNAGYPPAGPPPPYQEGIQLESNQPGFGPPPPAGDFGYRGGFPTSPIVNAGQFGTMIQQPIVQDMALQYGNQLAAQGRAVVQKELSRYLPVASLRYYFAVDTRYVLKKLFLILFPFTHKDWMVKYEQDTPVQPRHDLNAPDLYIPSMGYVTYVLLAGFMLGLQHKFSPEQIGIQASSALAYIIFEMLVYLATLGVTGTGAGLRTLSLLAFSGYKYVAMIGSLLAGVVLGTTGYHVALLYNSLALAYFLVQTLRLQLLSGGPAPEPPQYGYNANPYADAWSPTGAPAHHSSAEYDDLKHN